MTLLLMLLLLLLLLKSLLVFACAGAALLSLRRASAAARHLVCLLTLVSLLALPLFSLTLPGWHLPVLETQEVPLAPNNGGTGFRTAPAKLGLPPVADKSPGSAVASGKPGPAFGIPPSSAPAPPLLGAGGILALYLIGVLLASFRPLLGLWGIQRLHRLCANADDTSALDSVMHCAALLRLQPPRLCRAGVPVPMTWGALRPIVLLPNTSTGWPEDRLRSVLLHEMAHIKRRDWSCHRLADFVCALYWFHPLVWLTARRLRTESEVACDDLVLSSGVPAPDYARHLLEIAGSLRPGSPTSQSAIAMAQTSRIERRLTMILDKTRSRRTLTRRVLLAVLIPGTATLMVLAVLRPTAKADVVPSTFPLSTTSAPTYVDSNGTRIAVSPDKTVNGIPIFAGVRDDARKDSPWWSITGSVLSQPVYPNSDNDAAETPDAANKLRQLAFRLPPAARDVTVQYKMPLDVSWSCDGQWPGKSSSEAGLTEAQLFSHTAGVRIVSAQFPASMTKADIQVGIASGSWKVAESKVLPLNGTFPNGTKTFYPGADVVIGEVLETAKGHSVTVSTDTLDDLRVVAVDAKGREFLPDSIGADSDNTLNQITAQFNGPLSQIKELRVETRPFQWIDYKDVELSPAK